MRDPYKIYSVYSKAVLHFNKFCLFNLVVIHLPSHSKKVRNSQVDENGDIDVGDGCVRPCVGEYSSH